MSDTPTFDRGLSHIALVVREMDRSREFYETFAGLRLVHERPAEGRISRVAWLADPTPRSRSCWSNQTSSTTRRSVPLGTLDWRAGIRAKWTVSRTSPGAGASCGLRPFKARLRSATGPTSATQTEIRLSCPSDSRSVSRAVRGPTGLKPSDR